jgi:hypothetical protein
MSEEQIVSRDYPGEDEAIRAVQGLKAAGFSEDDIRVEAADRAIAERVAELTGASIADEARGGAVVRVLVEAGSDVGIARTVMVDGIVDTLGVRPAPDDSVYLDSSTGSTAGVGTSTGTATGMAPGAGYEGNTGSSLASSAGPLGQLAPAADTPDPDDDFPGRKRN